MQLKSKQLENRSLPSKTKTQLSKHQYFPVGSEVEVSSDEEGFRGVWYLATVVKPPPSSSSFLSPPQKQHKKEQIFVEYKSLQNGSRLLTKFVELAFVRPKPPVDDNELSFDVNDIVDAYFKDGWWTGVVNEVVCYGPEPQNKYRVFFSNPPDDIEFGLSDLRFHRNWVDGKWVLPKKQRMIELNYSSGRAVEVSIDPDNSYDVWFPATFIKQVTNNSFLVEYQSSRETGFQKVAVDYFHIRPSPPRSSSEAFTLLEKVDAFYDFRWLSGIVTKILADGRYVVYFKRTKKEKELCHADLRPHLEWTNGKWVQSSQNTSMTSDSGKQSDHSVNGGFMEKIHAPVQGFNAVKENLREETIPSVTLRSCPKELQMLGREKANYSSTTPSNKRIKQTNAICLTPSKRLNEESVSVVTLSPEACKSKMKRMEGSNNGPSEDLDSLTPGPPGNSDVKQSEDRNQSSASKEIKTGYEQHAVKRKRGRPFKRRALMPGNAQTDSVHQTVDKRPGPPGNSDLKQSEDRNQSSASKEIKTGYEQHPVKRKRGRPFKRRALMPGNAHTDSVHQIVNRRVVVYPLCPIVLGLTLDAKMIESRAKSSGLHPKENHKKTVEDVEKHQGSSADHESRVKGSEQQKDGEVTIPKRKRGRPPKVLFRVGTPSTKAEFTEKERKDGASGGKNTPEKQFPTNEVEKPVGISDSTPSTDYRRWSLRIISDQIKHLSDISSPDAATTVRRPGRKRRNFPKETVVEEINEQDKPFMLRRGRKPISTKQIEPPTEVAEDSSRERAAGFLDNGVARGVEKVVSGTSSNVSDDDRPLSVWLEGGHSPPTTDGITGLTRAGIVCESDETGERGDQNEMQSVGQQPKEKAQEKRNENTPTEENIRRENDAPERLDETPVQSTAIVAVDDQDLPFVKNSLIWKMIESMEVLKRTPQRPHFQPLYNSKEECREGLAIGSMVTFTSLVERISRLKFSDPKSLLEGYLEALVDLEELGFDVAMVREQLNTLLSIKGRYEHAQNKSKEIESTIVEHKREKLMMDEEIEEIDEKIAKLNERRSLSVSRKEQKDDEIKLLQSSMDTVKGSLDSDRQEFHKLTASLW